MAVALGTWTAGRACWCEPERAATIKADGFSSERAIYLAKTWVLDTHTKGTGANVVPLEDVLKKPGSAPVPGFGFRKLDPKPAEAPEAPEPRRFKVVDVMTREALAEGVDARTAVDVLEDVRSIVDVSIFVWEPTAERWRMLSFAESRMLWEYRRRSA